MSPKLIAIFGLILLLGLVAIHTDARKISAVQTNDAVQIGSKKKGSSSQSGRDGKLFPFDSGRVGRENTY